MYVHVQQYLYYQVLKILIEMNKFVQQYLSHL